MWRTCPNYGASSRLRSRGVIYGYAITAQEEREAVTTAKDVTPKDVENPATEKPKASKKKNEV